MTMQILNTTYPQNMLSGGLDAGKPTFSALRHVLSMDPAAVIPAITASGLRGRSGISRPAADKWLLCAAQPDTNKLAIMNTIDGDPRMPAATILLQANPAGVIEGLLIAAYAVGASEAIICLDADNAGQRKALESVLLNLAAAGLLGDSILGSKFSCRVGLADIPAKYVTREDTALIAALAGQPAMSGLVPPMPAEKGYQGRPTLVHHAETCAQVAAIFRQIASGAEPQQTKLVSLSGAVQNSGICELPLGIPLRTVFEEIGGGMPAETTLKFLQVGGFNGFLFTGEEMDITLDYSAFEATDRHLGNASILVRDSGTCVVDYVKGCADLAEKASCGKCVMGREGTWQLREFVQDMTVGKSKPEDLDMVQEISKGIREGSQIGRASCWERV